MRQFKRPDTKRTTPRAGRLGGSESQTRAQRDGFILFVVPSLTPFFTFVNPVKRLFSRLGLRLALALADIADGLAGAALRWGITS